MKDSLFYSGLNKVSETLLQQKYSPSPWNLHFWYDLKDLIQGGTEQSDLTTISGIGCETIHLHTSVMQLMGQFVLLFYYLYAPLSVGFFLNLPESH